MSRSIKVALLSALVLFSYGVQGTEILVTDREGQPVSDVVVYGVKPWRSGQRAVMDQENRRFVPRVLAVSAGTTVEFPNSDQISHHVYSFSPAKRFELPLYRGTTAEPVKFDVPGVVTLGCNIHDTMVGYIVVLESGSYAVTGDDGRVELELPQGATEVRLWHPNMSEEDVETRKIDSGKGGLITLKLDLALKDANEPTPLEDRFRRFSDGS